MRYKYVCAREYYPNCRSCDSGYLPYSDELMFFNSIDEILYEALNTMHDYELKTVYSTKTGLPKFEFSYQLGRHSCNGIKVKIRNLKLRTIDNGSGKLIWVKDET